MSLKLFIVDDAATNKLSVAKKTNSSILARVISGGTVFGKCYTDNHIMRNQPFLIGLTFTFGLKMCSFNLSLALIAYIGRGHYFSYFPGVPFYNFSRRGLKR